MLKLAIYILLVFACVASNAIGCRYNVRDTAFVDLGDQPYRLVIPKSTSGKQSGIADGFADANLIVSVAESDQSPEDWRLIHPDGRELMLGLNPESDSVESLKTLLFPQSDLATQLLGSHSILILVESTDEYANSELQRIVSESINATLAEQALWPKEIKQPPSTLKISADQKQANRVLLWALGIDSAEDIARVVVLFGRGRRLADPLEAKEADTKLERVLGVVSLDCECEYDIAPLIGTMIPHEWTVELEQSAVDSLGFDPGAPLVMSEVRQILFRSRPIGPGMTKPRSPLESPSFGFQILELPSLAELDSTANTPEQTVAEEAGSIELATQDTHAPKQMSATSSTGVNAEPTAEQDLFSSSLWLSLGGVIVVAGIVCLLIAIGRGK